MGYIYLFGILNRGQSVKKIGKTDNFKRRFNEYKYADPDVLFVHTCENHDEVETKLIEIFKENFILVEELGNECFIGDTCKMLKILTTYFLNSLEQSIISEETLLKLDSPIISKPKTFFLDTIYKCPRCSYETGRKSSLANHFNRKVLCENKNDMILTDILKNKILNKICTGEFPCDQCDKDYASLQALNNHRKSKH